jgi:3-oxoacyl-(acyl-carrier-protein) synthase
VKLDLTITGAAVIAPGPDLDLEQYVEPNRLRRMDPLSALAVAAARVATDRAGLTLERDRVVDTMGVAFGTAFGCQTTELRYAERLVERGAYFTNPIDFPDSIDGAPAAHVAMELGLGGPSATHADGHLAGELASLHGALAIANGRAERMLVVAGDHATPRFARLAADCATVTGRRGEASGVAAVVLEPTSVARTRGAETWARLCGVGLGFDAGTRLGRLPVDDAGRAAAVDAALRSAGLPRDAVDRCDGESTRMGAGGLERLVAHSIAALAAGDVRVIVHHATAPGGQSVALVLTSS